MIAALVTGAGALVGRLRTAVSAPQTGTPSPELVLCKDADALYDAVATGGATIVVIEVGEESIGAESSDAALEEIVRTLHTQFPIVPVLIYGPLTAKFARAALAAGRGGAREVLVSGVDDVGRALAPLLARATASAVANHAIARLTTVASAEVLSMLTYALTYARRAPSVGDLSRVLRVHRKTLAAWCRNSGAPPPGILVSWCRLIVAAEQLAQPGRSTERVAVDCGFRSGSSLANLLKRRTGLTRAVLRERGGEVVLDLLMRTLAQGRDAASDT